MITSQGDVKVFEKSMFMFQELLVQLHISQKQKKTNKFDRNAYFLFEE